MGTKKRKTISVAVVGAGMIKFGELFDQSYEDMIVGAYKACLKSVDKGIDEAEIEAAWLGTCVGSLTRREMLSGTRLSEPLALFSMPVTRIENHCATGSDTIRNAAFSVAAGIYDTVLVVGVEKMRDIPSLEAMVDQTSFMQHLWWHPRGQTPPAMFAQFGSAHMQAFGTTREHFARVAVKNHHNGKLDPYAHFQFEVTIDQVLKAPMVAWPMGLLDSCPTTDGAAAVILTRPDRAKEYSHKPIYLLGTGCATDTFYSHKKRSFTEWPTTVEASRQAYEMAGIGPKDVDLAELHDCFTCTELITYEDLGFCKKGEGGKWIEEGGPMIEGKIPCNTSGGLKSKGHPIGATGVAQACEIWWQLRGEAGKRQVKNPAFGLTHNLGGTGSISCVNIFGLEPRSINF